MTQFESVWDALEDTQEQAENMKLRSELMISIVKQIETFSGTQSEKAKRLGITQPRLNDLLQGRINKFSLDALVTIASATGLHISMITEVA